MLHNILTTARDLFTSVAAEHVSSIVQRYQPPPTYEDITQMLCASQRDGGHHQTKGS